MSRSLNDVKEGVSSHGGGKGIVLRRFICTKESKFESKGGILSRSRKCVKKMDLRHKRKILSILNLGGIASTRWNYLNNLELCQVDGVFYGGGFLSRS